MTSPRPADVAIARLDRWLDGMRSPEGYGGPVVHWWRDCVLYCGPGLDWRYEGIIDGYLTLFERISDDALLSKARRAADDLLRGQQADGGFLNSSFERNPRAGGTPHEAAADIALLRLAAALRARGDAAWSRYLEAAGRNIEGALIGRLWRPDARRFGDGNGWFVPNKAATIVEALCLFAELSGQMDHVARYVVPTADAILAHQLDVAGELDGAIAQASRGSTTVERYFPYYIARSIPGLCAAYELVGDGRYLAGALRAGAFIVRWQDHDGGWPQVVYATGRVNRYPRWIAATGDLLRALDVLRPYGLNADAGPTIAWILHGQLPSGAIRTAHGFGARVSQRPPRRVPDVRDVMPVVGWNDKAFRSLARLAEARIEPPPEAPFEIDCVWQGRRVRYREDSSEIRMTAGKAVVYRWGKGERWAEWRPARLAWVTR